MSKNHALEMSFFNTTITLLRGHEEPGHRFSLQVRVLVPGKTELIFAAARRGMARTLGLFHSTSAKAGGGWCPSFLCVQWCRARFHVVSNHLWMVCLSGTLSYLYCCCYCLLSYLIVVSSELFLSQHMFFTFL